LAQSVIWSQNLFGDVCELAAIDLWRKYEKDGNDENRSIAQLFLSFLKILYVKFCSSLANMYKLKEAYRVCNSTAVPQVNAITVLYQHIIIQCYNA